MSKSNRSLVVGIDASNLRQGGGRTHLIELLRASDFDHSKISKVVVWGSASTLQLIDDKVGLEKRVITALSGGLFKRVSWQVLNLSKQARQEDCDILLIPGGTFLGRFKPMVSMSQNLLPFEIRELRRYGFSLLALKLLLLRMTQSKTFRRSNGIIFLTNYAKNVVDQIARTGGIRHAIIGHGLNDRFRSLPREQFPIESYSDTNPFRIIYVSIVNQYKHQWHLIKAVDNLRRSTSWPIVIDLIGPAYAPSLKRMNRAIKECENGDKWVFYHGAIPFENLHDAYSKAHLGAFLSSCENLPNILLEKMASGLPIASSNRGPMPEVLKEAGVYFDPECTESIENALRVLIGDYNLRARMASAGYALAQSQTWEDCSRRTFDFLHKIAKSD